MPARGETDAGSGRGLTVTCVSGLSNRIRVLVTGLVLAEASGRTFRMLWPLNGLCGAPFASLFANAWGVEDVAAEVVDALSVVAARRRRQLAPDLLVDEAAQVVLHFNAWLVQPHRFPSHEPLWPRCVDLIRALEPSAQVRERVDRFRRERFRPEMIGVHLRRGDMRRIRPDITGNTEVAIAHVERFLAERPSAGVLLCTDDGAVDPRTGKTHHESIRERFVERFGERVVFTRPRSLDRGRAEAIEDAVVDLFLLRHTQALVGTRLSSFSDLAHRGRDVPVILCGAPRAGYRTFERLSRVTGLYFALRVIGRLKYGRGVPFALLWTWLVKNQLPGRTRRSPAR